MPRKQSSSTSRKGSSSNSGFHQNHQSDEAEQQQPWWVEDEPQIEGTTPNTPIRVDDDSVMSSMYIEEEIEQQLVETSATTDDLWQAYKKGRQQQVGSKNRHKGHRSSSAPATAETVPGRKSKTTMSTKDSFSGGRSWKKKSSDEYESRPGKTSNKQQASTSQRDDVKYWNCDACTYRNRLKMTSATHPAPSTCEICGTIHIHENGILQDGIGNSESSGGGVKRPVGGDEENPSWAVTAEESRNGRNLSSIVESGSTVALSVMSSVTSMFRSIKAGSTEERTNHAPSSPTNKKKSKRFSTNKRSSSTATELSGPGSSKDVPSTSARSTGDGIDNNKNQTRGRGSSRQTSNNNKTKNDRPDGSSNSGVSEEDTSESTSGGHVRGYFESTSRRGSTAGGSSQSSDVPQYTVSQLVKYLGATEDDVHGLPRALERRVRDFKFARAKRLERHGEQKPWGIYGLYAHLSDIRADLEWAEDAAWRRQREQPYLSWRDFEDVRDKGLHNRPWFTYTLLFLCSIMMIVTLGVNGWRFEPLSVNPLIGPSAETLIKCGARDTNLIVNEGQWYRLFTPLILHAGLVHYVLNMLALWFIGGAVEQSHGFASATVLFIIPAVGGNILSAICLPQYISVGASGGIFGLIGGCLADITLNWNLLFLKTTADEKSRMRHAMVLLWLGFDIMVNCLLGLTPFVDNFCHLGGLLYGFSCGISTIERLAHGFFGINTDKCSQLGHTLMRFSGLIVSIIAIMVTTVVLVQSDGVTSSCHGCRYISCVPFPPNAEEKWWYCDDCDSVTADLFQSTDGSGLYEEIQIMCPNGDVEEVAIADANITDKEVLRQALPGYCRMNCDEVFSSK